MGKQNQKKRQKEMERMRKAREKTAKRQGKGPKPEEKPESDVCLDGEQLDLEPVGNNEQTQGGIR
jgi:hypothetical protein